jgi:hypothetical protein
MRRVNAIATLTVAVCAAAVAYAWAWGPEGDRAAASPLVQEASDAATAPSTSASPEAPPAPEATASPTPSDPGAASPSAAPLATPTDVPSGAPPAVSPPPSPSAPSDVASPATVADVELSYLAWNPETHAVEASGYAAVYEDGGTCRLVLTRSGTTTSAESAALTDVQTTSCGGLEVLGSELSSGTWRAVLEYTSQTSAGSSAPREVVVP